VVRLVAFLKGINVGGHTVKMDVLKRLFVAMDFTEVSTFIASGNVVFSTSARNHLQLARTIEKSLEQGLGFAAPTFIRTADEVTALAGRDLFPGLPDSGSQYVGFLEAAPGPARVKAIMALGSEVNRFVVRERDVHWWTTGGLSDSGLSYVAIEKTVAAPATFRGMRTVIRLAAAFG
jgi:uncharacterized protein (DUF1697 family)